MAVRQWKPRPLTVTPEATPEQRRAGRYVCTATWGSIEEADRTRDRPVRIRDAHPLHDGSLSRVGWWDGQVVGHVGVLRIPLRWGAVTLETAGIAGVCADPRARMHGIASSLMRDALAASKQAGLCFSLLFGIRNFYHRFGFVPAFADHSVQFSTNTMQEPPAGPRWTSRRVRQADLPRMLDLYNGLYGRLDGSAVRHPRLFLRRKAVIGLMLQGPRKGDLAYLIQREFTRDDRPEWQVLETAGQGDDWQSAVLREAVREACKREMSSLILRLPGSHPICRRMIFCNATVRTAHALNGAAMACVLDFAGLARAMGPLWCRQIGQQGLIVPKGGLVVRFRDEHYRWWPDRADGRTEAPARVPRRVDLHFNDGLARLVMGYGDPEDILRHHGMQARPAALPFVRAMFPARSNAFSAIDHF